MELVTSKRDKINVTHLMTFPYDNQLVRKKKKFASKVHHIVWARLGGHFLGIPTRIYWLIKLDLTVECLVPTKHHILRKWRNKSKIYSKHLFFTGFCLHTPRSVWSDMVWWTLSNFWKNVVAKKKDAIWRFSLRIQKENHHIAFFSAGFLLEINCRRWVG